MKHKDVHFGRKHYRKYRSKRTGNRNEKMTRLTGNMGSRCLKRVVGEIQLNGQQQCNVPIATFWGILFLQ